MANVRLDILTQQQFGLSPEEANGLIMAGRIWIGHVPADKPGMTVSDDTVLTKREKARQYASRSGYKLAKALQVFGVDPAGLTVCDIGASNGGFTDCLLQNGAKKYTPWTWGKAFCTIVWLQIRASCVWKISMQDI